MKKVLNKSRHFPQKATFAKLSDETKRNQANWIIEKYKLTCEFIDEAQIDENCTYFHLCMVFHWQKVNKRYS